MSNRQQDDRSKRKQGRGRRVEPEALAEVQALLGEAPVRRELLVEYLHQIQDAYGAIFAKHLVALAHELQLAATEVFEVATFYHHFDVVTQTGVTPPALTVKVCESVTCELFGARELAESLGELLGEGVRVQAVPCVGRCQEAPVVVVGANPVPKANAQAVLQMVRKRQTEANLPTGYIGYDAYREDGGYSLLRQCVAGERQAEELIGLLEHSGLRGLGGAGFPAGQKWRIVRDQPGTRLLVANIDEGEPGTFKDRHYLERDPHRFIEGLLIAAWAVGCEAAYLYLRDEYAGCRKLLQQELAALQADPPVELPPIYLRRGAGAYVCGEESALVESLEGKRGMPRMRPPYLAEVGLFGQPTLVHNLETLFWVREIVERGAEWFVGQGCNGSQGLRSFSVSGRVNRPGVYLAPAGITARELIDDYCDGMLPGHNFYAYFPGGASGGILPASLGDLALDFDTLSEHGCFIGSAAVIVLSDRDSVRQAALNAIRFFAHESCGQCTPCRVGTEKAAQLMARPDWDQSLLEELAKAMEDASICGLGQAASNTFKSVIRYFPRELD